MAKLSSTSNLDLGPGILRKWDTYEDKGFEGQSVFADFNAVILKVIHQEQRFPNSEELATAEKHLKKHVFYIDTPDNFDYEEFKNTLKAELRWNIDDSLLKDLCTHSPSPEFTWAVDPSSEKEDLKQSALATCKFNGDYYIKEAKEGTSWEEFVKQQKV
jgi:hypothetical protein